MKDMEKIIWKRKGRQSVLRTNEKEGVVWLTYPALEKTEGIVHGFSTRLGGVSEAHLSSMNLSFSRGDSEENVRENYRRIAAAIGFAPENLVFSDQTHTTNVRMVTEADRGKGYTVPRDYTDVDGLITDVPGLVLATFYADCVPLYFVDPVRGAIGLSHSGWRGTVGRIGKVTVQAMQEAYGCRPENIFAAIGPSICQNCYEVSEDVIEEFQESFNERFWSELYYPKENGKYQLNLWRANEIILKEAGILPEHLSVTDICTCCNPDLLFSHRASHGMRGNLAAFLGIR
ncbi:MAG: peptidoglycan editing factor PgeF [Marvinbryantia sp.]|uniref:peptidoglycan editing factor PgeF n=1 Tax=Marvinbryantia sp. TaxID=2496532 RepID=UPI00399C1EFC